MSTMTPRADFDWSRVKWGGPNDPVSDVCSYCGTPLDEDSVPLRLWAKSGHAAVFCDACSGPFFGLKLFGDSEPY